MPDKRMKRSSAVPVDDVNGRYELIASVGLDESHRPPRINLKMRAQRLPALHLVEKMKQRFRAAIMKPRGEISQPELICRLNMMIRGPILGIVASAK